MKKIKSKSKYRNIPSVRIYKDDIMRMIKILDEVCDNVVISDDEFEYESLDEFVKERGERPKQISIGGRNPHVSVDLKQTSIWLYRSGSDKDSIYAYKGLEDLLLKKRNLIGILFNKSVGIISFVFLSFFLITMPWVILGDLLPNKKTGLLLILFFFGILAISYANSIGLFSFIAIRKSHEDANFFDRNKADIYKIIIGAVIGSLITWALTILTGK